MKRRVAGFDLARAFAIFGMVIVNFKIAMNAKIGNSLLITFTTLFEGRASALFVILAGIGVTLLTNRPRESSDSSFVLKTRISLIKRGFILVVIGLLYSPIWEADILHYYGVYFLVAAAIFMCSNRLLLLISFIIMMSFPFLLLVFNYEQNWDFSTFTYSNFWSFDGMFRHIIFNGFHPVFPWAAFLTFGMWLGRQDLSKKAVRNSLLIRSLIILIITEYGFYFLRNTLGDGNALNITSDEISFLFSTSIIPPLPQYIISSASSAVAVLIGCIYFSDRFSQSNITKWLCQTGQLSLTLYFAHVIFGMGFLESIGRLENQTIDFSLLSSLVFSVCGICFSVAWLKYFKVGPFEWIFRKLAT
jgi:uncharacterized protein